MKRQKRQKNILILSALILIILAAGIGIYFRYSGGKDTPDKNTVESTVNVDAATVAKTEFTDEEKERVESQTGVTVTEDGTVQVDIGEIQAEEESMTISREEATELVIKEVGDGAEVESMSVREEQDKYYWTARAIKGGEAYQVWIDSETGETFINQKE